MNNYCYGPDKVIGTEDDCGCPEGLICQNDGSCATPSLSPFKLKFRIKARKHHRANIKLIVIKKQTSEKLGEINIASEETGDVPSVSPLSGMKEGEVYDIVIKVPHCLSKKLQNIQWPPKDQLDFGEVIPGNLNDSDDVINSSDWAIMSEKWGSADPIADINEDGIVNTLDWSLMNQNWGKQGEE